MCMNKNYRILIICAVIAATAVAVIIKKVQQSNSPQTIKSSSSAPYDTQLQPTKTSRDANLINNSNDQINEPTSMRSDQIPTESVAVNIKGDVSADKGSTSEDLNKADKTLPRLVDFGASKCIACKMMEPILEELSEGYADFFKVEFVNVFESSESARQAGIRMIPTQIFYDSSGKELYRHTGYFSKDDILAKWKELGVDISKR